MGRRWIPALVMTTVFGGVTPVRADSPVPQIVLDVKNYVGVRPDDLARAKGEVERIFADAGLEVAWDATGQGRRVEVWLLEITRDTQAESDGCALGLAILPKSRTYVFVNRIIAATRTRPVAVAIALGQVIAHEVGHVLLPPGPHGAYGLMRAALDFDVKHPPRFTREEALALRAAATRPVAAITGRKF